MVTRRLLLLPPLAQVGVLALWWLGWPPSTRVGLSAQFAALSIMLVVYGALAIRRFRFLRRAYKDIKCRRTKNSNALQTFVDAQVPRP